MRLLALLLALCSSLAAASKPDIVIFYLDDMGWAQPGAYGEQKDLSAENPAKKAELTALFEKWNSSMQLPRWEYQRWNGDAERKVDKRKKKGKKGPEMTASDKLEAEGFLMLPQVLDREACETWCELLGNADGAGTRGMLHMPEVMRIAQSLLADIVRPHLPGQPVPVRGIYFDKRPETNWLVAWHQDLTLALKNRIDMPGWGPWSDKNGVPHVQPPFEWLERMLTVRLHLDDADEENGALRVLPGTHRHGRLDAAAIQCCRKTHAEVFCEAQAGDVLLMRPLLLHASSRSLSERRRRILHIEFAGFDLPAPLEWHEKS